MKKRIICVVLMLAILLSFSSCVIKQKYDYSDLTKYITIPTINGHEIKVELDMVQMTIDQDIATLSTDKYVALAGDSVNVVITITEYKTAGVDSSGNPIDQYGEVWFSTDVESTKDTKETITINNLGAGTFLTSIESRILKSKIGETTTENDFIIPSLEEMATLQANYPTVYEKLAAHVGQKAFISYSFISRPVREGDVVSVTYTGYETDASGEILVDASGKQVAFDGGSGTSKVYIGSRTFIEDFEKGLIGMTVGTEGQFKATFPSDYGAEGTDAAKLNGKTVVFKATVTTIYQVPTYDLAYIQANYGDKYTSIEQFEQELINSYAAQQIVSYLVSNSTVIKYPEKEYKLIKQQLNESAADIYSQYQMTVEEYLKYNGYESIDAYIYAVMKAEMAYYAYAQINGLVVTDADIEKAKTDLLEVYKNQYLNNSTTATEADATAYANACVEKLTEAELYQEALYAVVGDHIITQYKLTTVPMTYTSVTDGGSLFD